MKKLISGIIIASTVLSAGAVFAQETDLPMLISQQENTYDKVNLNGILEEYADNQLWMNDGNSQFVINTDENTVFVNAEGKKIKAEDLEKNSTLMIVSDIAQTRSIPPQSYGYVVAEATENALPVYSEIAAIGTDDEGNTVISGKDCQYEIIVTENTPGIEKIENLKVGDELLAYSQIITMSIPAKVPAEKVVILTEETADNSDEIYIGGIKVEDVVIEDGITLIPLRKICEDLGYTVEWDGEKSAVSVGTLQMGVYIRIGENKYSKAKMAASVLSKAPTLINEKTYVPSEFFTEILEQTVTNGKA